MARAEGSTPAGSLYHAPLNVESRAARPTWSRWASFHLKRRQSADYQPVSSVYLPFVAPVPPL